MGNTTTTPRQANSVKNIDEPATNRKSLLPTITSESSKAAIPLPSKTFDVSNTNRFSVNSPINEIPFVSSRPVTPVVSPKLIVQIVSPRPIGRVNSTTLSTNDTLDKSSNLNLTVSPDVSAIFPSNNTPTLPDQPVASIPVNTNNLPIKTHSDAPRVSNAQINVKSSTVPKGPHPTEVGLRRSISKTSEKSSMIPITKQKSIDLSTNDRTKKSEPAKLLQQQISPSSASQTLKSSQYKSKWTESNFDQRQISAIKHIIPVPSFPLRSTAVCNPVQENFISERAQSIGPDVSLFKFYLDPKQTESLVGNHAKATMFNMDTVHKRTPFPKPSVSFSIKNFNDGTDEVDANSTVPPTFRSLGLEDDFETELVHISSPKPYLRKISQQQVPRTPSFLKADFNSTKEFRISPSINMNQNNLLSLENPRFRYTHNPNLLSLESYRAPDNYQATTSILKKPVHQSYTNSVSTQTSYSNINQNNHKTDFEKYRAAVSFNVSPLPQITDRTTVGSENLHVERSLYQKH